MSKIFSLGLALSGLLVISACGNEATSGASGQAEGKLPEPEVAAAQTISYPSLPLARMQELYESVDYIDFVFYYADFSMNQSNDASIKATLAHVSNEIPTIYPSCQPIGSLFFLSKGQELIQAELYFSDKCVYYIWLENGKRTYANKMTPNGFQFYQKVFSQAEATN